MCLQIMDKHKIVLSVLLPGRQYFYFIFIFHFCVKIWFDQCFSTLCQLTPWRYLRCWSQLPMWLLLRLKSLWTRWTSNLSTSYHWTSRCKWHVSWAHSSGVQRSSKTGTKIFLLQYINTKLNEVSIIEVKGLYRGGEI